MKLRFLFGMVLVLPAAALLSGCSHTTQPTTGQSVLNLDPSFHTLSHYELTFDSIPVAGNTDGNEFRSWDDYHYAGTLYLSDSSGDTAIYKSLADMISLKIVTTSRRMVLFSLQHGGRDDNAEEVTTTYSFLGITDVPLTSKDSSWEINLQANDLSAVKDTYIQDIIRKQNPNPSSTHTDWYIDPTRFTLQGSAHLRFGP